jgi:membrane-bound serine protease (ClpP class)
MRTNPLQRPLRGLIFYFLILFLLLGFLSTSPLFSQTGRDVVYRIPIKGEIDRSLTVFLRRGIEKARAGGASRIVFEIDTFGGRVDAALQITTLIGSLHDIHTSAYVPLNAEGTAVSWSAGALIAFSCDAIFMAPGTSIGSAAPIMMSPDGGSVPAEEKTVSALRTQMAALAEKNGYPRAVALAMVDQDTEVIELTVDGEVGLFTREEADALLSQAETDGREMSEGVVVSAEEKLLSLTSGEMEKYRISSGSPVNFTGVLELLEADGAAVVELEVSGADRAVSVITGAAFTSLLIFIGMIALFMEITSPGFGIPGTIALLAFSVLFAGNSLLGTVGSVELLLFVIGIGLLVVEVFLIPGFGVAGISGVALIIGSLILSMQDFVIPDFSWQYEALNRNALLVTANVIISFVAFGILAFLVPKYTPFRRLSLSLSQEASEGFTVQDSTYEDRYRGASGTALTTLRPAGKAELGDEVVQVETGGEYLEKGTEVEVTRVDGNRIVVRRKK